MHVPHGIYMAPLNIVMQSMSIAVVNVGQHSIYTV